MSDKVVTGSALHDILLSVKDYVDVNDLDFTETELDIINTELPRLTLTEYNIQSSEIDDLIVKHFSTDEE